VGGNSGVQYRSKLVDEKGFVIAGYQGDFEAGKTYSGILYEERGRGILAKRGDDRDRERGFRGPKPAGRFGSGRGRERGDEREEFRARPRDDMDMMGGMDDDR
jgi:hypothetical protein